MHAEALAGLGNLCQVKAGDSVGEAHRQVPFFRFIKGYARLSSNKKIAWDGGNVNCVVHLPQALWYNEITVQLAYARKKGADEGWDFT